MKRFLLTVGRLEPRKNQLNLIRAVRDAGFPKLIVVGNPVAGFEAYAARCRAEAGEDVVFLPGIDHESPLLASAYHGCDAYALPGWFETPGLVALEAALAGTALAVTEVGSTREYFGSHAAYFDPSSPASMRRALQEALRRGPSTALRQEAARRYTWEAVALQTLEDYKSVLGESR
ncbi:MAG: glycosyltransferase [Candidatus Omnitrophica bacterium]|nr:glycosyltransferase [Candidatus Omnitrophota bacterium]